jgi:hypothetical protein
MSLPSGLAIGRLSCSRRPSRRRSAGPPSLTFVRPRRRLTFVPTTARRGRRAQTPSRSAGTPPFQPVPALPGRALRAASTAAGWAWRAIMRQLSMRPSSVPPAGSQCFFGGYRARYRPLTCVARKQTARCSATSLTEQRPAKGSAFRASSPIAGTRKGQVGSMVLLLRNKNETSMGQRRSKAEPR